jgi:hypothetical protein
MFEKLREEVVSKYEQRFVLEIRLRNQELLDKCVKRQEERQQQIELKRKDYGHMVSAEGQ